MTEPEQREGGLAQRLVAWMAANRAALDALMVEEASRARHLEFIRAERGGLPDRAAQLGVAQVGVRVARSAAALGGCPLLEHQGLQALGIAGGRGLQAAGQLARRRGPLDREAPPQVAVSYTHLTLPTKA